MPDKQHMLTYAQTMNELAEGRGGADVRASMLSFCYQRGMGNDCANALTAALRGDVLAAERIVDAASVYLSNSRAGLLIDWSRDVDDLVTIKSASAQDEDAGWSAEFSFRSTMTSLGILGAMMQSVLNIEKRYKLEDD